MPGHRSMSEHRRSVLSAEREIASLDGYARDSCPGCGGVRIGGAVLMTTAYEGSTARLAERPSRPRWAPSPWVQALRVRLARVPAAGALLRGRRRDEYSVQQLTCPVCPIRKEGVHDGSLGRRACVRQVPPPPVDDRLGARLPRGGAGPSLRARPCWIPGCCAASGGPSSRRGPRPGSARSRAWARTRTRGGPGRWPGGASPSRGCASTRRRARSASGRPPPPAAWVFPWSPAWSEPSRVSPARERLAGRQVDRGTRRGATGRQSLPCPRRPHYQRRPPRGAGRDGARATCRRGHRCPAYARRRPPVYLAALRRTPSDMRPTLPATGPESRSGGIRALAAAWASVIPGPACSPLSTASRMFACLVCVAGALPLSTTASRSSLSSPVRVTTYLTLAMPATSEEMVEGISSMAKITT